MVLTVLMPVQANAVEDPPVPAPQELITEGSVDVDTFND